MTGNFEADLWEAVRWFLITTPTLAALFLGLLFLILLFQARVPEGRIRGLFERRSAPTRYLAGATLGTVTPFCSMTTIPVLAGLLRGGVPFGPTLAFLVSSPLLDGVVLGVLAFLIGLKLTALYAALTFLGSMVMAALFARLGFEADVKELAATRVPAVSVAAAGASIGAGPWIEGDDLTTPRALRSANAEHPSGRWGPDWRRAWSTVKEAGAAAWATFVPLVPHLLLGTAIGAAMRGFLPVAWILTVAGGPDQPFAVPLLAAIGIPIYINAEILLPIAAALLDRGLSEGAVMAIVITGLGLSLPELSLLRGFFRMRVIVALVLSSFGVAVASGSLVSLVGGIGL